MIALYYPQNTPAGLGRLPMSLLALGAMIPDETYCIVDGNVNRNPLPDLRNILSRTGRPILAVSVMPGQQMINAIQHSRILKREFPRLVVIWGGYFPSMHTDATLHSTYVDYVLRGQGERSFPQLLAAILSDKSVENIPNLSYRMQDDIKHNPGLPIFDPESRPLFPYHKVDMKAYAIPTFVGTRTYCHESSAGCPHKCNFCGVVDVFNSRWKAESVDRTIEVLTLLKDRYGMNGLEFHDSDFFVSEKRVVALAEKICPLDIKWWAEGRVDTLLNYSAETWKLMQRSGLSMIFFGAESGFDETLELMDKPGVTAEKTRAVASLCKKYSVKSEFSFVMGSNPQKTEQDIDATIRLIYELDGLNPNSQMHPFIYTPVPFGAIYSEAERNGLRYPKTLDEWGAHEWEQYTLRQNPHTPWLTPRLRRKIINFRAVHQAYYPKVNDRSLPPWKSRLLRLASSWRYNSRIHTAAYEVRILLRLLAGNPSSGGF